MKKLFLKSFALVAMLLCGLTASASAVDWSTISYAGDGAGGGTYENKYKVAFAESGLSLVNIQKTDNIQEAGFYITVPDAAFGELRIAGTKAGYATQDASFWLYISNFTAKETEVQVMTSDNNAVRWTIYVYYEDGTDVPAEPAETIKPTMTSASLASVTYNSAVINVAGTDKETENGAEVAVTRFKVVYGETSKTYTATDGKIKIEGLELNKTYTFTIYAVDAAGNVSEEGLTVEATTVLDWSKVSYIGSSAGAEYTNQYKVVVVSGKVTIDVIQNPAQTTEPGIYCILPGAVSSLPIAGKTEGAGAWLYLSAFYKQETEVVIPYAGGSTTIMVYNEKGLVGDDSEKPVMVKAELVSNNHNSAVIAVEATDNMGVASYEVVDEANSFNANFVAVDGKITVTGLNQNTTYNLAISAVDLAGNVSAEAKTVQVITPTFAHPSSTTVPMHASSDVFSIYSDAYTSTITRATGSWGQQTKEQEVALAEGDNAFYYTNGNYLGWELNGNLTIGDMSLFPHLHMDIYVAEAGSIMFTPIWGGAEAAKKYTLVAGWNALDIDLAVDFAGINLKNIYQLKWDAMPAVCYIDNVYFWKDGASTAIDAQEVAPKVSKTIENGQIVIIREGVRYDVTGRAISK